MRILRKRSDLRRVDAAHADSPVRLPFKVDLPQLATFLSGEDPWESIPQWGGFPAGWPRSLEGFLAAQVQLHSGGATFSVSDLLAIAAISPLLLMLDGLDEVADISARRTVVETVNAGLAALRGVALSVQVIVTSRPAAFANSPGFSPRDFQYFTLVSLTSQLIVDYTGRWAAARQLSGDELEETRTILNRKLDEPHVSDLARNPMQLAILLGLIITKGESLPDKRTELYSAYMSLFFDREASKSRTVRDNRDLLYGLHGFLGWRLHAAAEMISSGGSIAQDELEQVVRQYIDDQGSDPELAVQLFQGVVERIIALVATKEGRFQFEVQPLREFFAAAYLYSTAPEGRFGVKRPGTRSDRFDALIRNRYWLNVTRFFAGFYESGELASLVDRIDEFGDDPNYRLTDEPRTVARTLLRDSVFALVA